MEIIIISMVIVPIILFFIYHARCYFPNFDVPIRLLLLLVVIVSVGLSIYLGYINSETIEWKRFIILFILSVLSCLIFIAVITEDRARGDMIFGLIIIGGITVYYGYNTINPTKRAQRSAAIIAAKESNEKQDQELEALEAKREELFRKATNIDTSAYIEIKPVSLDEETGAFSGRLADIGTERELLTLEFKNPLYSILFTELPEKYAIPIHFDGTQRINHWKVVIESVPTTIFKDHSVSSDYISIIVFGFSIFAGLILGNFLVNKTGIPYLVSLKGRGRTFKGFIYYFICVFIVLLPVSELKRVLLPQCRNCYIDNATNSDYEVIINSSIRYTIPSMKYIKTSLNAGKTNIQLISYNDESIKNYIINIPKTRAKRQYLYNISEANAYNIVLATYKEVL